MVQVTVDVDISGLSSAFAKFPEAKALGVKYAAEEMVRVLQKGTCSPISKKKTCMSLIILMM